MKLPLVSRKRYENERGRIVTYEPADPPKRLSGFANDLCLLDERIGWVKRIEFDNYRAYTEYLAKTPGTKLKSAHLASNKDVA